MERFDFVIIGGGIAGTSAAETVRQEKPEALIAIVTGETHPLYSRVLLPNFVSGTLPRERVFLRKPADYEAKHISLFMGSEVVAVDPVLKLVHLQDGREVPYGTLCLSTGGKPRGVGVTGEELPGVFRLQTIEDAEAVKAALDRAGHGVIIGGGFIAFEFATFFGERKIPASILFPEPAFFGRFVEGVGAAVMQDAFSKYGLTLIPNTRVSEVLGEREVRAVKTADGKEIPCDFIGAGVGIDRKAPWLEALGVLSPEGAIAVDQNLKTSLPAIFAAGDVAAVWNPLAKKYIPQGNWTSATLQGRACGKNMAHQEALTPFQAITSYSIRHLGIALALVGDTRTGEGIQTVSRGDRASGTYARFFIEGGKLIGAVLINRPQLQSKLSEMIRNSVSVPDISKLADSSFDSSGLAAA